MNCKFCGAELQEVERGNGGHRPREYCNDTHRKAYWRQQHQQDQTAALLVDLEQLRALVRAQAQEIADLRRRLDIERRYLEDTTPHYFRAWLRKQPSSPWRDAFLSDQVISSRGSRSYYEAQVKRLHCTDEEREDFVRLWKLMLLQA
jgi:hypothetical protein